MAARTKHHVGRANASTRGTHEVRRKQFIKYCTSEHCYDTIVQILFYIYGDQRCPRNRCSLLRVYVPFSFRLAGSKIFIGPTSSCIPSRGHRSKATKKKKKKRNKERKKRQEMREYLAFSDRKLQRWNRLADSMKDCLYFSCCKKWYNIINFPVC